MQEFISGVEPFIGSCLVGLFHVGSKSVATQGEGRSHMGTEL